MEIMFTNYRYVNSFCTTWRKVLQRVWGVTINQSINKTLIGL